MPLGTLSLKAEANPIFAPPYPKHHDPYTFSIDKVLSISYRVAASQVRHLVPDVLELEDEPLVTTMFLEYGMSSVGVYKEFGHNVEVRHPGTGEKFRYNIILILDNESAIFAGREQYGFPKVFGRADIKTENGTRLIMANTERPAGNTLVEAEFIPDTRLPDSAAAAAAAASGQHWFLNLRTIEQPHPGCAPQILELVPVGFEMKPAEVWTGKGNLHFPRSSAQNPWCGLDVLRYEGSIYLKNVTAVLKVRGSLPM
ncbi:hypothetical protein KVR01_007644 [Diaporthe batatas]|uniref:uncharacterized protein n=1 Tax=Diaporthe batatas TaxID=748121 RepID=UPI001D03E530|nr:uncharacterized protein KVR01_007644 [Diaporthe batatas]KAG8163166.1 hypothetical protein KVR01_007644 [Diaporthe batatas]